MELFDFELLASSYKVKCDGIDTSKTCLHLIVESGDSALLENFLQLIVTYPQKEELIKMSTMKKFEGQRARHLAAIHLAAIDGQTDMINTFFKFHPDSINLKNNKKDTPVLWAARWNRVAAVKTLLQLGAKPNVPNDKGSTALYWAVRYGYPKLTEQILKYAKTETERSAQVNYRRRLGFELPIILAAALGYTAIIDILVSHGAAVNATRTGGSTALHLAAMIGRDEVVRTLLDNKADKEICDDSGNTPLLMAIKNNHMEVANELICAGADFEIANKLGESVWDMAIDCPDTQMLETMMRLYLRRNRQRRQSKLSLLSFKEKRSPLHVAATKGDVEKVRVILDAGISADLRDKYGNTFLHVAARDNNMNVSDVTWWSHITLKIVY